MDEASLVRGRQRGRAVHGDQQRQYGPEHPGPLRGRRTRALPAQPQDADLHGRARARPARRYGAGSGQPLRPGGDGEAGNGADAPGRHRPHRGAPAGAGHRQGAGADGLPPGRGPRREHRPPPRRHGRAGRIRRGRAPAGPAGAVRAAGRRRRPDRLQRAVLRRGRPGRRPDRRAAPQAAAPRRRGGRRRRGDLPRTPSHRARRARRAGPDTPGRPRRRPREEDRDGTRRAGGAAARRRRGRRPVRGRRPGRRRRRRDRRRRDRDRRVAAARRRAGRRPPGRRGARAPLPAERGGPPRRHHPGHAAHRRGTGRDRRAALRRPRRGGTGRERPRGRGTAARTVRPRHGPAPRRPPRRHPGRRHPGRRHPGRRGRRPRRPRPDRIPPGSPQARCLGTGRPVADSVQAAVTAPTAHPIAPLGEGVHTYVAAPLYARGRVFGLAGFYRRGEDRPYEEDDLALAGELAARAAISVDNARRFSREHDASLTLQRSLLPHALPRLTAADLASRYLPADGQTGASAEVGGDWFDAIPLSGLRVALVVGDVAGHGLQAAATMGRLRTAVRTLAALDLPPEEVLAHLDELVGRPAGDPAEEYDPATATTCLYAVYDPVACRCTAARAGHPPPAVAPPGGEARLLDLPAGPPLGLGGLQPYESTSFDLAPGSLLALYTDGLLKEGLGYGDTEASTGRLLSALTRSGPARDPERVCDRITETVLPGGPRDDVALLVARVGALPADRVATWELPADPSVVAEARRLVRRKLTEWGLAHMEFTTGLVVSELVTNAVRYGGGDPVSLRLLHDETLVCEVSDHSDSSPRIRRAGTTEEGGRGLFLVAQFTRRWGARFMPQGKTVWAEQVPHADRRSPEADGHALLAMFDDVV
ncbi:SpoIIE family protein phosphatase [Streptomyces sudanensis]|uniref:SpoIIE family protein phosphatase n=1 Tax=Streptomyces sudanensis TaxID=436397 RepID=UPI0020CF8D90|nr:SpoIIE family protein phosphatase [Streptomyces sudanensis]MCQ0002882.1 SpoIIE family protein phosphatase [Streptomyces sudanensis]